MKKVLSALFPLLLLFPLIFFGCSQTGQEGGSGDAASEWAEIVEFKDQAEAAYQAGMQEIEPLNEEDPEAYLAESQRLKSERESQYDIYSDKLVTFINTHSETEPIPPQVAQAKNAYASYLVNFVGKAYITELGDYRRAVEVYEEALALDPENPEIIEALESARSLRFMTRERFDEIKKGMTFEEVQDICGIPNPKYIKEQSSKGQTVVGWYYPKEDKSAAGFFFIKDTGKVYSTKWDAIKKPEVKVSDTEETE